MTVATESGQAGAEIDVTIPMIEAGLTTLRESGALWNDQSASAPLIAEMLISVLEAGGYAARMPTTLDLIRGIPS